MDGLKGYSYSEGLLSLLCHDSIVPQRDDSDEYMISMLGKMNTRFPFKNEHKVSFQRMNSETHLSKLTLILLHEKHWGQDYH